MVELRARRDGRGRLLSALTLLAAAVVPLAVAVDDAWAATAGDLDPTFAGTGVVQQPISSQAFQSVQDMAIQDLGADGQRILVVVGSTITRRHLDGTLDTTFADDGVLIARQDVGSLDVIGVAVTPDGAILVGGELFFDDAWVVARYQPNGVIDGAFGDAGVVTVTAADVPGVDELGSPSGFGLQSTGRMVLAGKDACPMLPCDPEQVVAVRLDTDGSILATSAVGIGVAQVSTGPLAIGPSDEVVVTVNDFNTDRVGVLRHTATLASTDLSDLVPLVDAVELRVVVRNDGVVAMTASPILEPGWRLLRWTSTGTALGTTMPELPPGTEDAEIGDLAVTVGGELVSVGTFERDSGPDVIGVIIHDPDGDVSSVELIEHPGPVPTSVGVQAMTRLNDGSFRIAGFTDPHTMGFLRTSMVGRLAPDGSFDDGFGPEGNGFATIEDGSDAGTAVAVRPDRRIITGGDSDLGEGGSLGFVTQHLEAGPLDPAFGRDVEPPPSPHAGIDITSYALPGPAGVGPEDIGAVEVAPLPLDPATLVVAVAEPSVTFTVSNAGDLLPADPDYDDTFRGAMALASAATQPVAVELAAGLDIVLTEGEVEYTGDQDLTIIGNGSTIQRDPGSEQRILHLSNDVDDPALRIEGLSILDGEPCTGASCPPSSPDQEPGAGVLAPGDVVLVDTFFANNLAWEAEGGAVAAGGDVFVASSVFEGNGSGHGGAIWSAGSVAVVDSVFESNSSNVFDSGGAIKAEVDVLVARSTFVGNVGTPGGAISADGDVHVTDSTFASNSSPDHLAQSSPGGGAIESPNSVFVAGSTFRENTTDGAGGAIRADVVAATNSTFFANAASSLGGAINADEDAFLTHVTIVGNSGPQVLVGTLLTLHSLASVIANPSSGSNCFLVGPPVSAHSYDTDGSCDFEGPGDTSNGPDPDLDSDPDPNGGLTETIFPFSTSPLLNRIPPSVCALTPLDQAGQPRPQGGLCDIGSLEVFGPGADITVYGLDLDSQGRAVIVGLTGFNRSGVHRLLSDGEPDPTFNGGLPALLDEVRLRDVVIDDEDRIVVVGDRMVDGATDETVDEIVVLRLVNGALDATFGTAGMVVITPGSPGFDWEAVGNAVDVDAAGRIVVSGAAGPQGEMQQLVVARLLEDGSPDPGFAGDPMLGPGTRREAPIGFSGHEGQSVAVRDDGRIVVAGFTLGPLILCPPDTEDCPDDLRRQLLVAQYREDGSRDPTFGDDGLVVTNAGGLEASGAGVVLDDDGRAVVTGHLDLDEERRDLLLVRLLPDGSFDDQFGTGGIVTTDLGLAASEAGQDVALAPDGKIVVAGRVDDDRGTRALIARYLPETPPVGPGAFEVTPNPLVFEEELARSSSDPQTVTVTNGGTGPMVITGVTVQGPQAADFSIVDNCTGVVLAVGATCTVVVVFTPTHNLPESRSAALVFTHDAAGSPHVVALRGSVIQPEVLVSPPVVRVQRVTTVIGSGFPANDPVLLGFGTRFTEFLSTTADENGEIRVQLPILPHSPLGPRELQARSPNPAVPTDPAQAVEATAPMLVVPQSVQPPDFLTR